jgi:hypothetical protein
MSPTPRAAFYLFIQRVLLPDPHGQHHARHRLLPHTPQPGRSTDGAELVHSSPELDITQIWRNQLLSVAETHYVRLLALTVSAGVFTCQGIREW